MADKKYVSEEALEAATQAIRDNIEANIHIPEGGGSSVDIENMTSSRAQELVDQAFDGFEIVPPENVQTQISGKYPIVVSDDGEVSIDLEDDTLAKFKNGFNWRWYTSDEYTNGKFAEILTNGGGEDFYLSGNTLTTASPEIYLKAFDRNTKVEEKKGSSFIDIAPYYLEMLSEKQIEIESISDSIYLKLGQSSSPVTDDQKVLIRRIKGYETGVGEIYDEAEVATLPIKISDVDYDTFWDNVYFRSHNFFSPKDSKNKKTIDTTKYTEIAYNDALFTSALFTMWIRIADDQNNSFSFPYCEVMNEAVPKIIGTGTVKVFYKKIPFYTPKGIIFIELECTTLKTASNEDNQSAYQIGAKLFPMDTGLTSYDIYISIGTDWISPYKEIMDMLNPKSKSIATLETLEKIDLNSLGKDSE